MDDVDDEPETRRRRDLEGDPSVSDRITITTDRLHSLIAWLLAIVQQSRRTRAEPTVQPCHSSWYRQGTIYEATRTTLDKQVEWLHEIDDKAMRTLRFNVLLLGLLVPGYSMAVRHGPASRLTDFFNLDTALGIGCLITSTALAGLTYTASNIDMGVSADDVRAARRAQMPDKAVFDALVTSRAEWIRTNRRVVLWNSFFVTATVLLLIYGVVFLSLGVASVFVGPLPTGIRWLTYAALGLITIASRLL